jgi:hypothetical protein
MEARVTSPIAALFKYELQYLLNLYFELDISFAHVYYHSFDAWNAEELAATDYFKMLNLDLNVNIQEQPSANPTCVQVRGSGLVIQMKEAKEEGKSAQRNPTTKQTNKERGSKQTKTKHEATTKCIVLTERHTLT